MNRRDLLQYTGALGALAAISPALRGKAANASSPATGPKRRLLLVMAQGGWDTTYALDPKVQSDKVDVPLYGAPKSYGNYSVWTDKPTSATPVTPNVTAFFDAYAGATAIVRGISVASVSHQQCVKKMATGTREETNPDMGAIVAHDNGNDLPLPYLILGDTAFAGQYAVSAGRVGATNQIIALLDPNQVYATAATPVKPTSAEADILARYTSASIARARASRGSLGYNKRRIDDFAEAIVRGDKLKAASTAASNPFGKRGKVFALTDQVTLAISALSQGVSQAVMMNTRLGWDTHTANEDQTGFHDTVFAGLTQIMDQMTVAPGLQPGTRMIDDTVVVCFSEFSRTPKLNSNGGKDHWPVTSALVMGAGVKGGHAYGGTADDMQALPIDLATGQTSATGLPLKSESFVAGVLSLCGIDTTAYLGGAEVLRGFIA